MNVLVLALSAASAADFVEPPVSEPAEEYRQRRPPPPPPPGPRHRRAAPRPPPAPDNQATVSINLIDIPAPLISGDVEMALGRRAGLAVGGGFGIGDTSVLYRAQGDLRGYFLGDFDRGWFVEAGGGVTNFTPLTMGDRAGLASAAIGGKYTFTPGFTMQGSVGAAFYGTGDLGFVSPTARIALGWSF